MIVYCAMLVVSERRASAWLSHFAVYAEMGRHPFYLDIVKSMLLFWHRADKYAFFVV